MFTEIESSSAPSDAASAQQLLAAVESGAASRLGAALRSASYREADGKAKTDAALREALGIRTAESSLTGRAYESSADESTGALLRLFSFGLPVAKSATVEQLGDCTLTLLIGLGIIIEHGEEVR